MSSNAVSEAAKAVVRRNTEEVQGRGDFRVFEQLFADDFVDHTTQPGTSPDKAGVRKLYTYVRAAFPDFHAEIHWQHSGVGSLAPAAVQGSKKGTRENETPRRSR